MVERQSELFTKTRKDAPRDEVARNAELLIRGGFIYKELAGAYAYLPLGLKVLKKIENIIREEMVALGGQELYMTALQDPEVWKKTDRWDEEKVDNWFKTKLHSGGELGLSFTHEEPLSRMLIQYVSSYKDLPFYVFQFQTKFRNELRAKSGILRGREFLMKDLYSFVRSPEEHDEFYEKAKQAYFNIFNRVGIGDKTYLTFASGGTFAKFSHEFQTLTDSGEDTIYLDEDKGIAVNKEVYTDEVLEQLNLNKDNLAECKAIEVSNIFSLGTRFSDALELTFTDKNGENKPVIMGSYGIGLGRLMGTVVEVSNDKDGIIWPESISPYDIHVLHIGDEKNVREMTDTLLTSLDKKGKEVLYDDRDVSAGEKFADRDLLGIPISVIVSSKGAEDNTVEIVNRSDKSSVRSGIDEYLKSM